jgi:hypothetical protein
MLTEVGTGCGNSVRLGGVWTILAGRHGPAPPAGQPSRVAVMPLSTYRVVP